MSDFSGLGLAIVAGKAAKALFDYSCTKCDNGVIKVDCSFFNLCANCRMNNRRSFWQDREPCLDGKYVYCNNCTKANYRP